MRAQRPPVTKAIDIWALGVTLYCFIFGRCPFIADTEFELFFNVIPKQPLEFPKDIPIPDDLKDLLMKLLEKDPNKRITLEEVKVNIYLLEILFRNSIHFIIFQFRNIHGLWRIYQIRRNGVKKQIQKNIKLSQ